MAELMIASVLAIIALTTLAIILASAESDESYTVQEEPVYALPVPRNIRSEKIDRMARTPSPTASAVRLSLPRLKGTASARLG